MNKPDALVEKAEKEIDSLKHDFKKLCIKHIYKNPSSLSNMAILYDTVIDKSTLFTKLSDLQIFKVFSDSLMSTCPNSPDVRKMRDDYQSLLSNYKKQKISQLAKNKNIGIPKLEFLSVNGGKASISDMDEELVLLSFWSIYDKKCIGEMQKLKSLYDKYHPKGFGIYQVSIDKSIENWKRAVCYEELKWTCVIDTLFPQSASATYNITQLPSNVLLSIKHDSIIGKDISTPVLERKLQREFN